MDPLSHVSFGYSVETEDIGAVGVVLGNWARTESLQPGEERGTKEIHFDSGGLSLYGFLDTLSNGPSAVVVTGSMVGDVGSARPKLEELRDAFEAAGLKVSGAEYMGCDAEEEPTTEEFRLV